MTKKLFVVDTIVSYRIRYVIEADELSHAYDTVVMSESGNPDDEINEFSQRYTGQQIIDGREVTEEQIDHMIEDLATSNDETSSHWMGKDYLINKINYNE